MNRDMRIIFFGIIGSILTVGGTIAIAVAQAYDDYSYYPILVFFGGFLLIYAVLASLIETPNSTKISK